MACRSSSRPMRDLTSLTSVRSRSITARDWQCRVCAVRRRWTETVRVRFSIHLDSSPSARGCRLSRVAVVSGERGISEGEIASKDSEMYRFNTLFLVELYTALGFPNTVEVTVDTASRAIRSGHLAARPLTRFPGVFGPPFLRPKRPRRLLPIDNGD